MFRYVLQKFPSSREGSFSHRQPPCVSFAQVNIKHGKLSGLTVHMTCAQMNITPRNSMCSSLEQTKPACVTVQSRADQHEFMSIAGRDSRHGQHVTVHSRHDQQVSPFKAEGPARLSVPSRWSKQVCLSIASRRTVCTPVSRKRAQVFQPQEDEQQVSRYQQTSNGFHVPPGDPSPADLQHSSRPRPGRQAPRVPI